MRISRRKMVIGLTAIFGGSGAIVGSGAFDSLAAERTVSLSTSGDSSAELQLEGTTNAELVGTEALNGNSVMTIENQNLNERSRTVYDGEFTVTNNGADDVVFYVEETGGVVVQDSSGADVNVVDFEVNGSSIVGTSNSVSLNSGNSVTVSVAIDITAQGVSGSDLDNISSVTFVAESTQA